MSDVRCLISDAFNVQLMNRGWVHICRRGNRACTAVAHICEQERFAADKHVEASLVIDIATAARAKRPLTFWMLDPGLYLGFGAWSLGFRARLVASSDLKRIEKSFGVIP